MEPLLLPGARKRWEEMTEVLVTSAAPDSGGRDLYGKIPVDCVGRRIVVLLSNLTRYPQPTSLLFYYLT